MIRQGSRLRQAGSGCAANRRLVVALLVAAVLWLALLRATHIHEAAPRTQGDHAELCDLCAQLSAPAGLVAAPPGLVWFAVWSVIALVVRSRGALASRPHTYHARGPPPA